MAVMEAIVSKSDSLYKASNSLSVINCLTSCWIEWNSDRFVSARESSNRTSVGKSILTINSSNIFAGVASDDFTLRDKVRFGFFAIHTIFFPFVYGICMPHPFTNDRASWNRSGLLSEPIISSAPDFLCFARQPSAYLFAIPVSRKFSVTEIKCSYW